MKKINIIFYLLLLMNVVNVQADSIVFFDEADAFFKKYVLQGRVNYLAIKKEPTTLNNLVNQISKANVGQMDKKTAKAFYLNSYNILVIKSVVEKYPISSPMDVEGFFDKQTHQLAGKNITLNDLENKIIRPTYKDSRIHFALVCAAKGCPEIAPYAFKPNLVEGQLQTLTVQAMNNPTFTQVDRQQKKVLISEIFKWYQQDFLAEASDLLSYVNKYRTQKVATGSKVGHYVYNWELNDTKK